MGRLMLGEIGSWQEFLEPDTEALEDLPRKELQARLAFERKDRGPEIRNFCDKNFMQMDEKVLAELYDDVKANRGLEIPVSEFEKSYSSFTPNVLRHSPYHATLEFSLWGMQVKYPEDKLSKDIIESLRMARESSKSLVRYDKKDHRILKENRAAIAALVRKKEFSSRACLLVCFNLCEAYLNGLAWDFLRSPKSMKLSQRQRKLLEDSGSVSIRDKIVKYPSVLTGTQLWTGDDPPVSDFLQQVKPFRDSVVHPSPFSVPDRFGGYDKLRNLYRVDLGMAEEAAALTVAILLAINEHVQGLNCPNWLNDLRDQVAQVEPKERRPGSGTSTTDARAKGANS